MNKALYIILLTVISLNVKGYSFKLTVPDLPKAVNFFMVNYGHKKLPIDTLITNDKGELKFDFMETTPPGLYRIQFSSKYFIDFIFNKEDVEISTLKSHWNDSLKVHKSEETKAYYIALNSNREFKWKMRQLSVMLDTTAKANPYFQLVKNEHYKLQKQQKNIADNLQKHFPSLLVTKMTRINLNPFVGVLNSKSEREKYIIDNFFNNVTFKDTSLIYTNAVTNKVYNYLNLFYNSKLPQLEQQQLFIEAVDNVMPLAYAGNEIIFEQVLDFLIDHFSKLRFDNVLNHILETYVEEHSCENYEVKASYEDRINNFLKIKVGDKAPSFNLKDVNGNTVNLSSTKSKFTLLVFWASWCPHCVDELPKIKELYTKYNRVDLEVITVSLDYDEQKWKAFVNEGNFNWISSSDLKGWKSEVVKSYNVYGTPTIFMIDKNNTIVAKPANLSYLKSELKTYLY